MRRRMEVRLESDQFPSDRLQIREIRGRERISRPFEFEVLVAAPAEEPLSPRSFAGARAALIFIDEDRVERRRVFGMIAEVVDLLNTESDLATFRLRFVPRTFRLGLVRLQEIYMNKTLQEIVEQKLDLVGLDGESAFRLRGEDPDREFVVQYDETDAAFVSRLTEHVGWSFFFDHADGFDRVVFTDHNDGFPVIDGGPNVPFRSRGDGTDVYHLELRTRLIPALFAVGDFNYMKPQLDLSSTCEIQIGYGGGVIEYGTHHLTADEGAVFARVRAEELQVDARVFRGEADVCTLAAGSRFTLTGHPRLDDIELLVVSVEHHLKQVAFGSGDEEGGYRAVFEAIPAAVPYRPPRETPRPRIHGVVSGIIEADPGVETAQAWIDDQGRYLVRMLFDTAAPGERKASLPIRMAQAHSGPGYGIHFPLRPGAEVLVTFLHGDPDRPVIVGSVPNAATPTPVVDKDATLHRIRTWSGVLVEIDDGG